MSVQAYQAFVSAMTLNLRPTSFGDLASILDYLMQNTQWFVRQNGDEYGPFTSQQLKQMAGDGRLLRSAEVRNSPTSSWKPVARVRGLRFLDDGPSTTETSPRPSSDATKHPTPVKAQHDGPRAQPPIATARPPQAAFRANPTPPPVMRGAAGPVPSVRDCGATRVVNSRKPSSRPIARAIQVPNNLPLGLGIAVAWYVGLTVIAIFVFCSQSYRASRQEAATEGELGLTKSDIREFEDRGSLLSECIDQVNQVTGLGLSPSLGMAVHSAATYYQTSPEARSELMVLYQPIFWGPLTVFLVLIAFKAHFLTWLGPLRWVFDILEMAVAYLIWPIAGYYVLGTTISELPEGAGAVGGLAGLAMSLYGIVFMYVVLLLNHGIELGILFCPVPLLDTGLKWLRLFVIVYLQLLAYVHPLLGFMAAAPVVCLALYMVPTSLRTVRMGMTFVFDYLLRRWRRWDVAERPIFAFTWGVAGASTLSFGRLRMDADGRIQFEFYPWFFGKSKRIAISPEDCAIGQKTLAPSLITRNPNDTDWHAYLLFPPRFRGHETALAGAVGVAHVQDISMTTSLRKLWQSLRDAFFRVDLQSAEPVAG